MTFYLPSESFTAVTISFTRTLIFHFNKKVRAMNWNKRLVFPHFLFPFRFYRAEQIKWTYALQWRNQRKKRDTEKQIKKENSFENFRFHFHSGHSFISKQWRISTFKFLHSFSPDCQVRHHHSWTPLWWGGCFRTKDTTIEFREADEKFKNKIV